MLPCDDATVIAASKHRQVLAERYRVVAADWSVTEKFIVKKHTYEIADRCGVPCPKTCVAASYADAAAFARSIGFPLLLKPCVGHSFSERFRKKMIVAHDRREFDEGFRLAEGAGVEMMIQELIPGDDAQGANYNSFVLAGRTVCEFTADKVRLSPPGTGFPRVVVSRRIPEICDYGRRILAAIGYEGFSCVEFKKDSRNGVYKLMEVNGRQNLSSPLAVKCGMNFPYITYRHALDGSLPEVPTTFKEGVYWIDFERDLLQSLVSFQQERFSWKEYLRPYRNDHVYAIWSPRDPAPFFEFFRYAAARGRSQALAKLRSQGKGINT